MVANTSPRFPLSPNIGSGIVSAANANYDGTGTIVTIFSAGASGSKVNEIVIRPIGSNAASVLRIFLFTGSVYRLLKEFDLPATNAIQTAQLLGQNWYPDNLILPPSHTLVASVGTVIAAGVAVTALGADY